MSDSDKNNQGSQAYVQSDIVEALRNLALNDYHRESSIDRDVTNALQLITQQSNQARIDELRDVLENHVVATTCLECLEDRISELQREIASV